MTALTSDWLRHFRLLLWNRWTEFDETWQEARSQRPLQRLCFSGWPEKQDGRPGLWLAETFSISPLKPLIGIWWNLTGSKFSTSSTKFVFFGLTGKTRWPPWPLIGWDIFDFSSETDEQNSTKLDRKKDCNVLYQVCVFGPIGKQDGRPGLWLAEPFSTSPLKLLNRIQPNLTGEIFQSPLLSLCFSGRSENRMAILASDWLRHFWLFFWHRWMGFDETWQEARFQRPLPSLCFWVDRKNKMAALASDLLRHFRLLLWNRWTACNETWQEERSQRPLPNLFFGLIGKTRWPPWPIRQKGASCSVKSFICINLV